MKLLLETPTKLRILHVDENVKRFLTFRDKSVDFQISKLKQNYRWKNSDPESFNSRLDDLKCLQNRCLLLEDADGYYTYSGLATDLMERFKWDVHGVPPIPDPFPIPLLRPFPELFYYQAEAVDALSRVGHGAIELPTAAGKSLIILSLMKKFPVKSMIVTPSAAITDQLFREAVHYFGVKNVGKYGDGSKKYDKRFTICTAQALAQLRPDSEIYQALAKSEMFIADESHRFPADIFEKVCMGVGGGARLRFFVSATQTRTDGSEMLLKGITGPIVYRKDFRELCSEGFLAKPYFKIFHVSPTQNVGSRDAKTETRRQLYLNPSVNRLAGEIAVKSVTLAKRQTLIIVEQFDQFIQLKNYINIPFKFVHGGASSKEIRDVLPEEYWKCDTEQSVKDFNQGKINLLIGTSAIATGVDTKAAATVIYLQGGTSEIKVKQALGRGTRIKGVEGKKDLWVVDFCVDGSPTMERHIRARQNIYRELSDEIREYRNE